MSLNLKNIFNDENENKTIVKCSICLDVIDGKLITLNNCLHTFHQSCISSWFLKSNTCPLCRETILDIFKCIYLSSNCFLTKKKKIIIEFKPNKLVFYKLETKKRKKISSSNTPYLNLNIELDISSQTSNMNNLVRPESPELDLSQKNHILQLLPNEKISNKKFKILYTDISRVNFCDKKIMFLKLKINKNEKKAKKSEKNTDIIKIIFPNSEISSCFFNILKKRHQCFRETNL